jgi:hypothetical protein
MDEGAAVGLVFDVDVHGEKEKNTMRADGREGVRN